MITQTLKLNLIPGQVLPRVNVSQYDAGTRTLQMLLYNGDQAFNISAGLGGFVQGTKPDRTGFQYAATVTEGSNVVTLVITQQMTAVSGEVTCELVIASGNDRIATVNFILYVEPAALADDTVISDTELPLIEEAIELGQRIDEIAADIEADADRAEAAVEHYPYIGANGNWYVFDLQTEQFVDTTIAATGPQGPQGDDGPTGPQGPTGPTGNGIVSITKTGTSGLVDTYTILFTDGTTTTFTVTNGQDGQGSGDMTKAVYDSTNAVADAGGIVAYVAAHSGAGTLAGLDDVTLSSLAAGDTLVYNATTQKWENSTVIQTLTNDTFNVNDTAITEVTSNDLLPIYDTSATGKKKIAVSNFVGGLVSNPNLLDNPWFTVNQRGKAQYTTGDSYCLDRWHRGSGTINVTANGFDTTLISGETYTSLYQIIENSSFLNGKTATASILYSNGTIKSGTAIINTSSTTVFLPHGANLDAVDLQSSGSFRIIMYGSATRHIRAIKLELGSVSTLAMDTAPNYATELLKCQRYFVRYISPDFFEGYTYDATTARFGLVLPVPMRTDPSFRVDDITHLQVIGNGSGQALTTSQTISNSGFGTNKKVMEISGLATALSANIPVFVKLNSGYIDLSADL